MAFRPSYGMPSYPHYPPQQPQIVFGQMRMPGTHPPPEPKTPQQTPAAVFVGNISEKCTDEFIQKMLNECGQVASWKRIKGNNGILQAFGFCTFADLEGTLRALRILHEFHLGDKKLTVKAEEKVRNELRKTAIENRKKQGKKELRLKEGELPADEEDLKKDEEIRLKILHWMETDHKELLTITEDGELSDGAKKTRGKEEVGGKQSSSSSKKDDNRNRRHRSRTRSRGRSSRRSRSKESPRAKKSRRSRSSSGSSSESDSSSSRSSSYSSRSRSRSPQRNKNSSKRRGGGNHRSASRSSEDSEDAREKRQMKQMMKEKEQAYHARLKRWEARERQMSKKYEKEERREKDRKKSLQKESKRLKTFLEDYDDERDDPKFFKSSLFFQRKRDFEREREADQKDRIQEQQEIEELKKQILAEAENGTTINVDEEARKRHKQKIQEEEANRKMRADSGSPNPHQPLGQSANGAHEESSSDEESSEKAESQAEGKEEPIKQDGGTVPKGPHTPADEPPESAPVASNGGGWKAIGDSQAVPSAQIARPSGNVASAAPKKEPSPLPIAQRLNGVFGNDDDEDDMHKRKKLKPFEITREERMQVMSVDEKKELTKQIIRKIPLTKDELFVHKIEWEQLDRQWMNDRIRPWVLRKISSFIGDPDTELCDFICEQLELKASPEKILTDVAVVIEEDAEEFVIKMWRLLIYEGQARRLGIT